MNEVNKNPYILDFISIPELDRAIVKRCNLYAFDKVSDIFSDLISEGVQSFIRLIERTLQEYTRYKSFTKITYNKEPSDTISLLENVDEYIAGNIPEQFVKYHFLALENIDGMLYSTRSFSIYNHVLHYTSSFTYYTYKYLPVIKYKTAEDGYFTEDSRIFGINMYENNFLEHLDYNVLMEIQTVGKGLATIPETPVELFPNIDNIIQIKRELIDRNKQTSTSVASYWANRGL